MYYPGGCNILDVTFGSGALWWKVFETPELARKYIVTACDAVPFKNKKAKAPKGFRVLKRNILEDSYEDLGKHDVVLVDFPYKIGKPTKKKGDGTGSIAPQLIGPRSWINQGGDSSRFMYNESVEEFNERVKQVNIKVVNCISPQGILINKIMNVSDGKGHLAAHAYNCWNLLTNFRLIADSIYVRHDIPPFKRRGQLERIHGHFQIYRLKDEKDRIGKVIDDPLSKNLWENNLEDLEVIRIAKNLKSVNESICWLLSAQASRRGEDWALRSLPEEERIRIENLHCMRHVTHMIADNYIVNQTIKASKISPSAARKALDDALGEHMGGRAPGWPSWEWKQHKLWICSSGENRVISLNTLLDYVLKFNNKQAI